MGFKMIIQSNRLKEIQQSLRQQAGDHAEAAAMMAATEMKTKIQQPGSGRTYLRGKGRKQVASAPGKPPATDMGELASSIQTGRLSDVSAFVEVQAEHAEGLEFGTARMAPRPFFIPAAMKAGRWFLQQMAKLK